jgi:hypothetical protein
MRPHRAPLTVRIYFLQEVSLPDYLIAEGFLVLASLVAAFLTTWTVEPAGSLILRDVFGELHRTALDEMPWALTLFIWCPTALICLWVVEIVTVAIILDRFRKKRHDAEF